MQELCHYYCILSNFIKLISGLLKSLILIFEYPNPRFTIILESPLSNNPESYFGKKIFSGEKIPPKKGIRITPPCICPESVKAAPHDTYSSKYAGLCANKILNSFGALLNTFSI